MSDYQKQIFLIAIIAYLLICIVGIARDALVMFEDERADNDILRAQNFKLRGMVRVEPDAAVSDA